ncbi:sensor histidine kinase [Pseudalkalibacillus sp. JSM 102089]|uniref:sensor histidine kinase n=1 Tax=Pseudalkalibacillus sp. JSM 102089 TaxID=3229856 RepID=UPI0035238658
MKKVNGQFFKRLFAPQSLRYQLLIRMLFILSFILMVIGLLQFIIMKDFLYENEAASLRSKLMTIPIEALLTEDILTKPPNAGDPGFLSREEFSLAILDEEYTDLLSEEGLAVPEISESERMKLRNDFDSHLPSDPLLVEDSNGTEQIVVFRPIPPDFPTNKDGFLQMGISTASLQLILWRQLLTFMVLSLVALLAGLGIYLSVIRKTLNPLSTIVDQVKSISASNLTNRVPDYQGQEEIDRLSRSFNEMLERLDISFEHEKELKDQMRQFIADASHELRTPLTSIYGYIEVLLRGASEKPEQLAIILNSMHGETKRVITLVEELLLLAKLDRAPELHLKETNLTKLVRNMIPNLTLLADKRTVHFDLTEGLKVMADPDKIKQVILNIFHNAVHHTDHSDGSIQLSLIVEKDKALISIKDNGPGINKDNLAHVFDRFYRVDDSRTRKYGGAGLGLSITKSIVESHKGSVEVESSVGEGATFKVYLNIKK